MSPFTVGMVSLGCPKNQVDTEGMLGVLKARGFRITPREEEADLIIVNTCGFIQEAKEESIQAILEMARHKKQGRCRALVVTGCLAQRYREALSRQMPEVDAILGTDACHRVAEVCHALLAGLPVPGPETSGAVETWDLPRQRVGWPHTAYLKIAEGCDHGCTFCVIPQIRGPFRSRPPEAVLEEARRLAGEGVRELVLVSQDTSFYGRDLGERDALPRLLRDLARVPGIQWIRVLYLYPTRVHPGLLEAMAEEEKICPYLDIPIQHIDDELLKAMGRAGRRRDIEAALETVRRRLPHAVVRTSLIVGFPGETEARFRALEQFVQEAAFDRLGVFLFSPEEGTPAARMPGQVPRDVARQRRERLMALQEGISLEKHRALVGTVQRVLVDGPSAESELLLAGRTPGQAPEVDGVVYLTDAPGPPPSPGSFVDVEITEAHPHDLVGRVVAYRG